MSLADPAPALRDRDAISRLVDRYVSGIDAATFDDAWTRSIFTDDAEILVPIPAARGEDPTLRSLSSTDAAAFHEAVVGNFVRTQHISANHLVEIDGDRATAQANVVAFQTLPGTAAGRPRRRFDVGSRLAADAVRTPSGWRFARLTMRMVWTTGAAPSTPDEVDQ